MPCQEVVPLHPNWSNWSDDPYIFKVKEFINDQVEKGKSPTEAYQTISGLTDGGIDLITLGVPCEMVRKAPAVLRVDRTLGSARRTPSTAFGIELVKQRIKLQAFAKLQQRSRRATVRL